MKYNVYMIEDSLDKHRNFLKIIERANSLAQEYHIDVRFNPGFGDRAEIGRLAALNADKLAEVLQDPFGLYLVDLEIKRTDPSEPNPGDFLSKYCVPTNKTFSETARCFSDLREKNDSPPKKKVLTDFAIAIHVLIFCKLQRKEWRIVSTAVPSGVLSLLKGVDSLFDNTGGFPFSGLQDVDDQQIEDWAQKILQMVDPLDQIKGQTRFWFPGNYGTRQWESFEKHGPSHNFADIKEAVRQSMIPRYLECVKKVFPWAKKEWWDSDEKVIALHQCLKTVVGTPAQWMGTIHDKPLSLAGAYLVFLIALSLKSHCSLSDYLVEDWRCFCSGDASLPTPLPFMASQDQECAARTFRCLYEFFLQIILLQDGTGCGLGGFSPPSPGHPYFSVKLKWGNEDLKRLADEIRSKVIGTS